LAARDPDLASAVDRFGPPPLWGRPPGFATLVRIILEQQVSLRSAAAAYRRLRVEVGRVTPVRVAERGTPALRAAGLTRQKAAYCVALAEAIVANDLDLAAVGRLPVEAAHARLVALPGVGPWTADIYLLMALRHPDVWPRGDLALAKATWRVKRLRTLPDEAALSRLAEAWIPLRAVAARILWHVYLSGE
jgi:DNA-3-methyladenine glycosylase II